jgi:hypothetical protein
MKLMSKSTLTRRALVASTAAASLGLPAAQAASEPDPIFAAIEAHRKAEAEFGDRVERKCALERVLPDHRCKSNFDSGKETIVETDDPRWIAAVREEDEGSDLAREAVVAFATTKPTTIAGVRALLAYFAVVEAIDDGAAWPDHVDEDGGGSVAYFVARNAAAALAKIIVA